MKNNITAAQLLRAGENAALLGKGSVLVALSGGADSTALLLALREYGGMTLAAAHFNHCLRGDESDRDEAFCRALCERLGVPFYAGRADVEACREKGEGTEEAARRLRYAFLLETAETLGAERIALAHNANDLAETLIMNLARGAGADGLRSIPLTRPLTEKILAVRPMLHTERREIEAFLSGRGETFVTDSTNLTDDYTRNLVRHRILPQLEAINPRFVAHAAQATQTLSEDAACLDSLAAPLAQNASAAGLSAAPRALRMRALRLMCAPFIPSRTQCEALEALCLSADPSARVSLGGGLEAQRIYDRIVIAPRGESAQGFPETPLHEGDNPCGKYTVTLTRGIAPAKTGREVWLPEGASLTCRPRRTGDAMTLPRRTRKTLKKLFIDEKVPARDRDALPVITLDGVCAAVIGFGSDEKFLPEAGSTAWHITAKAAEK